MSSDDGHPLGYRRVDASPDPEVLLDRMVANARWSATVALRAWERERLRLQVGERLLDVGCGLGDAARVLADDLGATGGILGVDVSTAMLDAARLNWDSACPAEFTVGDAQALDVPSGSFDVARGERVLQWLLDPQAAVTELARVLRPGGRLSLIDTDWGSLRLDIGADDLADAVRRTMSIERARPSGVGRRLSALASAAGFCDIVSTRRDAGLVELGSRLVPRTRRLLLLDTRPCPGRRRCRRTPHRRTRTLRHHRPPRGASGTVHHVPHDVRRRGDAQMTLGGQRRTASRLPRSVIGSGSPGTGCHGSLRRSLALSA